MKKVYLILALLLLVPIFDSCIGCHCEITEFTYDYSSLDFYSLTSLPVETNEQFETEVLAVVNVISQHNESYISGSALMACSCVVNSYPLYTIREVEVTTVPSFYNSQDSSSVIDPIVEISYFTETEEITVNLGDNDTPQFSYFEIPFFTAKVLERPNDVSETYAITFHITKSNGEIVESTLSDIKWE